MDHANIGIVHPKGKEGKKRQDKQVAIVKQLIGID